jgi:hypothetical protein
MNKKINYEFGRKAIDLLCRLVPTQMMKLEDGEGHTWTSECKDVEGCAITIVQRDGETVARHVYDYETSEYKLFLY